MGELYSRLDRMVDAIEEQLVERRRDFHRHAEAGWTEFRTASLVARSLADLGYRVSVGREVLCDADRMGLPDSARLAACWERARAEGGDPAFLEAMRGGFTGVLGTLGDGHSPVVALRFDIDAVEVQESRDATHRPAAEGFASIHAGEAHACGHDAHAAVGLGLAHVLGQLRDEIEGTVKLVFQPAEEGVRGAKAMVSAGLMDDVDYLLGHHLYAGWELGEVAGGMGGYLATTKFDVVFRGEAAHAAGEPQRGRNALLAAATAVLNLHAIPRHRDGATRVNVGRLVAGSGRNVVPAEARLDMETRGATTALNDYVYERARRVLAAAAEMYACSVDVREMGGARGGQSDRELARRVESLARRVEGYAVREPEPSGGSEDFTYMMGRVQERGGLAANIGLGAGPREWGHHTARFDLDERALGMAVRLLAALVLELQGCAESTCVG